MRVFVDHGVLREHELDCGVKRFGNGVLTVVLIYLDSVEGLEVVQAVRDEDDEITSYPRDELL